MNELLINLDVNAKVPLYEQIYNYIRHDIVDGKLSRGERLPSTRLLAANLRISRSTVEAAYEQLVSEGYLEAKRGSGYFVCDIGPLYNFSPGEPGSCPPGRTESFSPGQSDSFLLSRTESFLPGQSDSFLLSRTESLSPEQSDSLPPGAAADVFGGRINAFSHQVGGWTDHGGYAVETARGREYNFMPGQIDGHNFPYSTWRKVSKEALLDLEQELVQSGHPQGEYIFREVIARYLYRARGVRCVPGQIVIGAGNEYLLQLLGQILGLHRQVAMESPTYLQAYETFWNMGYKVSSVPMDSEGMLVEQIDSPDTSLVYVMPSHQFPLGTVMPLRRRAQLLAWADAQPGRYIIEDDHDSEFRYRGKPIPSLHSMAKREQVVYLGTFSNSIMPSIRVSYMVLPPELLREYRQRCGFYASTVSRIQQMTVCRFMEGGYFERHLNKMRGIYKGKHDFLLQLLKGRPWVRRIYGANAGLHIVVELNCAHSEAELVRQAAAHGLRLLGISDCFIAGQENTNAYPVLLLGFGNLTEQEMAEGVAILEQIVQIFIQ